MYVALWRSEYLAAQAEGQALLQDRRILLIISGGIAAYKSLDLIRRLRERGAAVRCVMTAAAQQFVTPLSVASLSEDKVYDDLWSLTDESEMGHIRLSREADLVVVAPASADLIARMAAGLADDLATTALLASDKPVLIAPTMNVMMWAHPATQANLATLAARGVMRVGPGAGELACGEVGSGRMAEPLEIVAAIERHARAAIGGSPAGGRWSPAARPASRSIRCATSRTIPRASRAMRSPRRWPRSAPRPCSSRARRTSRRRPGSSSSPVETAAEMLAACEAALPVDVAVMAAAVADWRVAAPAPQKLKKDGRRPAVAAASSRTPTSSRRIAQRQQRPAGARHRLCRRDRRHRRERPVAKRARKGCDWILANDVSPGTGTFGGDRNTIHLVDAARGRGLAGHDQARGRAARLAERIAGSLGTRPREDRAEDPRSAARRLGLSAPGSRARGGARSACLPRRARSPRSRRRRPC